VDDTSYILRIVTMSLEAEGITVCTACCATVCTFLLLYCTVLCYTILYCTILYYTVLYYTILYYTILYCTILYYTILYYAAYAILLYTRLY